MKAAADQRVFSNYSINNKPVFCKAEFTKTSLSNMMTMTVLLIVMSVTNFVFQLKHNYIIACMERMVVIIIV